MKRATNIFFSFFPRRNGRGKKFIGWETATVYRDTEYGVRMVHTKKGGSAYMHKRDWPGNISG